MRRTLLIVRAAFNLLFGITALTMVVHEVMGHLQRGGFYMLADRVLALAIAVAPPARAARQCVSTCCPARSCSRSAASRHWTRAA